MALLITNKESVQPAGKATNKATKMKSKQKNIVAYFCAHIKI